MINLISLNETQSSMRSLKRFLFLAAFSISSIAFSQYTEELNSNRPGASQGAYSVGTNVLQFEAGLNFGKEEHRLLENETGIFNADYAVRYGVWKEELEVSIIGSFQSNNITDLRTNSNVEDFRFANFRSNTVGAKYLFFDPNRKKVLDGPNLYSWKKNHRIQWADLIPAVSLYAGANFDFIADPEGKFVSTAVPEVTGLDISPKIVLATQNNFVGGFVFVTNIYANRVTTDYASYGYVITLTHTPTDWFSIFVENEGTKSDTYSDQLFRAGAGVLINENFQVDLSGMFNFKDTPSRTWGRIGVSYRLDMHDDDEFLEDKGKLGREKRKAEKNKKKNKKKEKKTEDEGGKSKKEKRKKKIKKREVEKGEDDDGGNPLN